MNVQWSHAETLVLTTLPAARSEIEIILSEICTALQITATQHKNAEEKYLKVGAWLAERPSPLENLRPVIFVQGSMALQTSVRPRTDDESYDLDLVLLVEPTSDDPMSLYRLVEKRLLESPHYRTILERKKRCITLNFVGDDHAFHMDVLPARPDPTRGGMCIEVPDRNSPSIWQPSNPRGYRDWFEGRATSETLLLEKRMQEPLPPEAEAQSKAVLKRAVQLLKRRRDISIEDMDFRPRSVLLTTLAALHYRGERSVAEALRGILARTLDQIVVSAPSRIEVPNPTNPDEKFCESFKSDSHYQVFVDFVTQTLEEVEALGEIEGLPRIEAKLSQMFGERVTKRALLEYGRAFSDARSADRLKAAQLGAAASLGMAPHSHAGTATTTRRVASNTFYGD